MDFRRAAVQVATRALGAVAPCYSYCTVAACQIGRREIVAQSVRHDQFNHSDQARDLVADGLVAVVCLLTSDESTAVQVAKSRAQRVVGRRPALLQNPSSNCCSPSIGTRSLSGAQLQFLVTVLYAAPRSSRSAIRTAHFLRCSSGRGRSTARFTQLPLGSCTPPPSRRVSSFRKLPRSASAPIESPRPGCSRPARRHHSITSVQHDQHQRRLRAVRAAEVLPPAAAGGCAPPR
ncbi:hypothetical protein ON010_g19183 [Phytophthora cinnamomi]|nr:hypothetical protein ON010_g19183 [Phytophthora cinnamomi]